MQYTVHVFYTYSIKMPFCPKLMIRQYNHHFESYEKICFIDNMTSLTCDSDDSDHFLIALCFDNKCYLSLKTHKGSQ
jgi:hypothetical protein